MLAQSCANLAVVVYKRGRHHDAEQLHREAAAIYRGLVVQFPGVPDYQNELGDALHNVAMVLLDRKELSGARPLMEETLVLRRAALLRNPRDAARRRSVARSEVNLADALVGLGDHRAAAATAQRISREFPDHDDDVFLAASFLARCVPLAGGDASLPDPVRSKLGREYGEQAVALLRRTLQRGFVKAEQLRREESFAPLRPRADFQELLGQGGSLSKP
jgi:hypothetical protein